MPFKFRARNNIRTIVVSATVSLLIRYALALWGRSSVGRATALQAVGRRFEPVRLHQIYLDLGDYQVWASSSVG